MESNHRPLILLLVFLMTWIPTLLITKYLLKKSWNISKKAAWRISITSVIICDYLKFFMIDN